MPAKRSAITLEFRCTKCNKYLGEYTGDRFAMEGKDLTDLKVICLDCFKKQ